MGTDYNRFLNWFNKDTKVSLSSQQVAGSELRRDDITVGGCDIDREVGQEPGYGSHLGTCSPDAGQIFRLGQSTCQDVPNPSLSDISLAYLNSDFPPSLTKGLS